MEKKTYQELAEEYADSWFDFGHPETSPTRARCDASRRV